jgi:aspartate aminotransferase
MPIAERTIKGIAKGSYIRRMFEEGIALKKIHGNDKVFDLSLGNPILEPPAEFRDELKELVSSPYPGMHAAVPGAGDEEARSSIADRLHEVTGVNYREDDIVMAFGTAGAVNIVFKTLLDSGDEVISFTPNYFEYEQYAGNHGGMVKYLPSDSNFDPDFEVLERNISKKTKAVVVNSPNNPTGHVYQHDVLKKLAEVILRSSEKINRRIYVVSDDVYTNLYFGEGYCPRIAGYYPHTIITTSYSKDLSLPGERIGYVAVNPECEDRDDIIKGLIYSNKSLGFINAPAVMQKAVRNMQDISVSIDEYRNKRDFLYDNLTKMGYSIVKPQGAFYIFPASPIEDDEKFIHELKDLLVLTVPGFVFEAPGYFRISYCIDDETIHNCLEGFEKAMRKYR